MNRKLEMLPSTLALPNVHRVEVAERFSHIIGPEKGRLINGLSKAANVRTSVRSL